MILQLYFHLKSRLRNIYVPHDHGYGPFVVITNPILSLFMTYPTRVTSRVPLVEQENVSLPECTSTFLV